VLLIDAGPADRTTFAASHEVAVARLEGSLGGLGSARPDPRHQVLATFASPTVVVCRIGPCRSTQLTWNKASDRLDMVSNDDHWSPLSTTGTSLSSSVRGQINEALDRLRRNDVRFRFVSDLRLD
jgi:hypothetical protein